MVMILFELAAGNDLGTLTFAKLERIDRPKKSIMLRSLTKSNSRGICWDVKLLGQKVTYFFYTWL